MTLIVGGTALVGFFVLAVIEARRERRRVRARGLATMTFTVDTSAFAAALGMPTAAVNAAVDFERSADRVNTALRSVGYSTEETDRMLRAAMRPGSIVGVDMAGKGGGAYVVLGFEGGVYTLAASGRIGPIVYEEKVVERAPGVEFDSRDYLRGGAWREPDEWLDLGGEAGGA